MNRNLQATILLLVLLAMSVTVLFWWYLSSNQVRKKIEVLEVRQEAPPHTETPRNELVHNQNEVDAVDDQSTSAFPLNLDVMFPNGELVNVTYSLVDALRIPRPRMDALDQYIPELINLANQGNGEAAVAVHDLLQDCASTPRSIREFEESVSELQSSGTLNHSAGMGVEPGFRFEVGSQAHQQAVTTIRMKFDSCSQISNEQIEQRDKWKERGLELGSTIALSGQASALWETDPKAAYAITTRLWESGETQVVSRLAHAHSIGVAPGLNGKPDLVTAHAFSILKNKVFEQAYYANENPNAANIVAMMDSSLSVSAAKLTLDELEQAENLAVKLLKENKNCCKGIWSAF